ncbi:MAG: NapC/NirT family cytochrome c [Wenzhouxiangellaceae bacterium]|nr:NapC/NirT family cytochrome c [Wenzhouxiangellaceae bacterium]
MANTDEQDNGGKRRGIWTRIKRFFTQPSTKFGFGALLVVGIVVGALAWQGFMTVVDVSSSNEFCSSCHEMEAFIFPYYENESIHHNSRSGVVAKCKDCHVPKEFFPKMQTKIKASLVEVPGHLTGRIATREKFEAHKLEMAEKVWARMKATDSRECRNCHKYEAMSADLQVRSAQRRHSEEYREATGKTCIDCHKGVAHELPAEM